MTTSLILSNDIQNEISDDILVAPITSVELENIEAAEVFIKYNEENGLKKDSKALIYMVRTIDKNHRLKGYIGRLNDEEIENTENAVKLFFDLE